MAAVVSDTVEVTAHAEVKGPPVEPALTSGQQELYENLINQYIR